MRIYTSLKNILFFNLFLFVTSLSVYGARVDTLRIKSSSMNKEVEVIVVVPDISLGSNAVKSPVVYLLHGYGGNAKTWLNVKPELVEMADERGLFFVCPDGKNSWYWDSPLNADYCYETFISNELVRYIDSHYSTLANRNARAITGLSMGGHGALWNAIRHTDVFGAAGSTSGGVDIRPFPSSWEMKKQLGEWATHQQQWNDHTVITQVYLLKNGELALIIDCGRDDFFAEVNKKLHQRLLDLKIDHDFILRPGAHNGTYWSNSIDYQVLFFSKFFQGK